MITIGLEQEKNKMQFDLKNTFFGVKIREKRIFYIKNKTIQNNDHFVTFFLN